MATRKGGGGGEYASGTNMGFFTRLDRTRLDCILIHKPFSLMEVNKAKNSWLYKALICSSTKRKETAVLIVIFPTCECVVPTLQNTTV
jgi:hypothetical protein